MRAFWIVLACTVLARLALVLTIGPAYGFHRDELLYFAMADHLDWWRMQFPPLIAAVARAGLAVAGESSTLAARIPAAAAATALTGVVLLIARRLGGGPIALVLAGVAMLAGPIVVRPGVLLQPVIFDQLWYTVAALGLLMAAQDNTRGWMWVGAGLGLGGLTKFSVAFFAFGITAAVLASFELRASLRTRWPWLAAGLALSIALPSFTGQQHHDWPFLVQARQLRESQLTGVTATAYFTEQGLMFGGAFLLLPFAAAAAVRQRDARVLGVSAVAVVLLLLAMNGKAYYAAPAYMPLIAVGAVAVEQVHRARRWVAPLLGAAMLTIGIALVPAGSPVLAPASMSRYALALGLTRSNRGGTLALPQDYADMIGWDALAREVSAAWDALPGAERARTEVLAINYGRAGALARLGPSLGLPYPISLHGDFWAWGHGSGGTRNLLVIGESPATVAPFCEEARSIAIVRNPLGVEEEQEVQITYCRGLRMQLEQIWSARGPQWG